MRSLAGLLLLCAACASNGLTNGSSDLKDSDLSSHPLGPPLHHRASATMCPTVRGPTSCALSGFPCQVDADCTSGKNGRCYAAGNAGCQCSYDQCFSDVDCAANQLCDCRTDTTSPNRCVASNCRTDADCGAGGFCSPTFDEFCGPFLGVVGWYCHTPRDTCVNDSDCPPPELGSPPFCSFHPETQSWSCSYSFCAG